VLFFFSDCILNLNDLSVHKQITVLYYFYNVLQEYDLCFYYYLNILLLLIIIFDVFDIFCDLLAVNISCRHISLLFSRRNSISRV